uniref:Uncharacterized protein n=1 Tax=Helianthus annuus TaxID=4232 RepID=A0A251S9U6_HELAN
MIYAVGRINCFRVHFIWRKLLQVSQHEILQESTRVIGQQMKKSYGVFVANVFQVEASASPYYNEIK